MGSLLWSWGGEHEFEKKMTEATGAGFFILVMLFMLPQFIYVSQLSSNKKYQKGLFRLFKPKGKVVFLKKSLSKKCLVEKKVRGFFKCILSFNLCTRGKVPTLLSFLEASWPSSILQGK